MADNTDNQYLQLFKLKKIFKSDPRSYYHFVNSKRRASGHPSMITFGDIESFYDLTYCLNFFRPHISITLAF